MKYAMFAAWMITSVLSIVTLIFTIGSIAQDRWGMTIMGVLIMAACWIVLNYAEIAINKRFGDKP